MNKIIKDIMIMIWFASWVLIPIEFICLLAFNFKGWYLYINILMVIIFYYVQVIIIDAINKK